MTSYLREVASRLVAFDTVSSKSNAAAVDYLAGELDARGFHVAVQRFDLDGVEKANLLAWAGPPSPGGLLISGHVDVVPHKSQPGWTRDPLRLEIGTERVYGRGASDMKVFLAQCVDAAAQLDRSALRRPVVYAFTADEEVGSAGMQRLVPELERLLGECPRPDLAWIGEPTSYEVFHAHKGLVRFSVTVLGRSAHSGIPHRGVNAIAVMGKVLEAIGPYQSELVERRSFAFEEAFPEAPYTTLNVGTISGGTAANIVAEKARIEVSYRPLPEIDPLEPYREIGERIGRLTRWDYSSSSLEGAIEISQASVVPPLASPRGTDLERALFLTLRRNRSTGAPFATDGPWLNNAGFATLVCGPGELDQAHQPDESISRHAFERGSDVILSVIHELCGPRAPANEG